MADFIASDPACIARFTPPTTGLTAGGTTTSAPIFIVVAVQTSLPMSSAVLFLALEVSGVRIDSPASLASSVTG